MSSDSMHEIQEKSMCFLSLVQWILGWLDQASLNNMCKHEVRERYSLLEYVRV
jgi:hypothetical protein